MRLEQFKPGEEDLSELVALAQVEYGDSEMTNPDYLEWQYVNNPAGAAVIVVSRDEGGQLAGQYVVIPMRFLFRGEVLKGSLSLNTLTHPEYRGRGLFTQMAKETYRICAELGLSITLGFPNPNSYPGFVRKLEFQHVGNAEVLFRLLRPLKLLRHLPFIRRARKYEKSRLSKPNVITAPLEIDGFTVSCLDFDSDAAAYDLFARKAMGQRTGVWKDAAYCQWRFMAIPTRTYHAFKIEREARILASCVVHPRRVYGLEGVFLVDFKAEISETGDNAARVLVDQILRLYKRRGCVIAGIMVGGTSPEHRLARQAGFRRIPERLLPHEAPVIIRRNGKSVDEGILNYDDWSFSFSDYDVF